MEEQTEHVESSGITDLRKSLKAANLVFGTEKTLKLLKQGKLSKIFLSSNAPDEVRNDCSYYADLSGVVLVKLDIPNDELGTLCKKPYSVSIIGLLK